MSEALEMSDDKSPKDFNSLELFVKKSLVEKFSLGNERPCESSDFSETKKSRDEYITYIREFFEKFVKDYFDKSDTQAKTTPNPHIENELLALILILCGQNIVCQPWNTNMTVKNCEVILAHILKLFDCKDASELISRKYRISLTKDLLKILCADLTVNDWKHFPASVACYKWVLEMIKQPDLSQHLQFLLPPALLLTDDFVKENRITGIQCLNHIVQNITIAELKLGGYGDVIYNALLPILRIREADLIQPAIITLVSVTKKLEYDLGKKDPTKWSKFDDILEIFLENMELEQIIDLRNCYISNLSMLISALEYGIIRWSKRLLKIFDEYVQTAGEFDDDKAINQSLKAIEKFLEFSREVTSLHANKLLFTLLIALHSTGSCISDIQKENKELTVKSIKTILQSISESEKVKIKMDLEQNLSSDEDSQKLYKQIIDIF